MNSNNVTGVVSGSEADRSDFQAIATPGRLFRLDVAPFTLSAMDGLGGRDDYATTRPPSRQFFVDGGTTTPTAAQTGGQGAPFKTIQQALNATTKSGTQINIGAGPQTNIANASFGLILSAVVVIFVESTTGFPTSGTLQVSTSTGVQQVIYTGITPNSFTGVAGGVGVGTMNSNVAVLGLYTENLVMPDVDRMTLLGSGPGTIVTNPIAGGDTLAWVRSAVPGLPVINQFRMAQIYLNNTSPVLTDACMRFDATLETGTTKGLFANMLFEFDNVQCVRNASTATNVFFRTLNRVTMRACPLVNGIVDVRNCSLVFFDLKCSMSRADLAYDVALPQPIQGRNNYAFTNASNVSGAVNLSGHPNLNRASQAGAGADTTFGGIVGAGLTVGLGGFAPSVSFYGEINGASGVVLPLPSTLVAVSNVDFTGARFRRFGVPAGYLNVTSAGGGPVQPVIAWGAKFDLGVSAGGAPTADAVALDPNCSWDIRGATYAGQAMFSLAGGTLDRSSWVLYQQPNVAGPVVIAPAFPVGITGYMVGGSPDTPANQVAITAKGAASFTSTPIAPGGFVDFLITRAA